MRVFLFPFAAAAAACAAAAAPTRSTAPSPWASSSNDLAYPSLALVENALLTTAKSDFDGHAQGFKAAAAWNAERLRSKTKTGAGTSSSSGQDEEWLPLAPHLACAEYESSRQAFSRLQHFLSPEAVRPACHSKELGACYFVTCSEKQATAIQQQQQQQQLKLGLKSFSPFPSALKLAPGLVSHDDNVEEEEEESSGGHDGLRLGDRLIARHGALARKNNVVGLSVELTPGILPAHSSAAGSFITGLLGDLMSESLDLHATNFWSDPAVRDGGEHLTTVGGAVRGRDWSKAATVVHELSDAAGTSPGDICSWDSVVVHHGGDDLLLVAGLDHLLYSGKGAGGTNRDGEAAELHSACFMGLSSFFAGRLEVLRVAPRIAHTLHNGAARPIIQTATLTDTPLTDAGLDGTGQVIQITDSGLDESSCFFVHDESGDLLPHGHYLDEWTSYFAASTSGELTSSSSVVTAQVFTGGNFTAYPDRRKIIQYIDLVKSDDIAGSNGDYFTTSEGREIPWLSAAEFGYDYKAGHGTHVAGSAAGVPLNNPAELVTCEAGKVLSCAGGCIDDDGFITDDLVTTSNAVLTDIDRLCPAFGCDPETNDLCMSDDVSETLTSNAGMAQGAKLSIFDVFFFEVGLASFIGNGLWEPCEEAGCKLHSNSWGGDFDCQLGANDVAYDQFMYENPENLLLFGAGNEGNISRSTCTIISPGIAKNVLTVGATVAGSTRFSGTAFLFPENDTTIDTVAFFSSYGPTTDRRIKPEVMAPGDMVYSATSDGENDAHSCRLHAEPGTSMSCPIVAGAAAMIRQYFMDDAFYAADMSARGFCDEWIGCEAFTPSSATIKALLINSANLMGGTSEPDGRRGFGRIHLEEGMPLAGNGSLALFVADANTTSIAELTLQEHNFDVDADAGSDLRVTLSWIDIPATTFSAVQLVHDLDLVVISPSGVRHRMWTSGVRDEVNVNERVVVDAVDAETGTWSAWVWAQELTTGTQSYSLVVNGAISPATGDGAVGRSSSTSSLSDPASTFSPTSSPRSAGDGSSSTTDSMSVNDAENSAGTGIFTGPSLSGSQVVLTLAMSLVVGVATSVLAMV